MCLQRGEDFLYGGSQPLPYRQLRRLSQERDEQGTDPVHLFHPLFTDGLDHGPPGRGVAVRDGDVRFIG